MDQPSDQKFDAQTVEALKAANREVFEAAGVGDGEAALEKFSWQRPEGSFIGNQTVPPSGEQNPIAQKRSAPGQAGLSETLLPKLTSLEQEQAEIDRELVRIEASLTGLAERKRELAERRSKLVTISDKVVALLAALEKEISTVLNRNGDQP